MIQWAGRITITKEVAKQAYAGELNKVVNFTYINTKTGKEKTSKLRLDAAIKLAESRRDDGRYKNYEFHID